MRTYVNEGSITAIGIIFPVLGVIALAIRAYGWRYKTGKLEIDDILIIPAAVSPVATVSHIRSHTDWPDFSVYDSCYRCCYGHR